MNDVTVLKPIDIKAEDIKVMPPVAIDSVNIFQSWSYDQPIVGQTVWLPAIVVDSIDDVPSNTPPGTAILVRAT